MTGFELIEALIKMPANVLRLPIYCGADTGDNDEIVELIIDKDDSITMHTIEDVFEIRQMDMSDYIESIDGDADYWINKEREWESRRIEEAFR